MIASALSPWARFVLSAAIIVAAAVKLADYGDVIGLRTRLGGMFVGTLLLAGATSLPELLTAASSLQLEVPNLTVGDIFGSSMFNMLVLAVLSLLFAQQRFLRRVVIAHALSAALAVVLSAMAMFFILANLDLQIGWVGLDSLLLMGMYLFGMWLIRNSPLVQAAPPSSEEALRENLPSLRRALIGFGFSALILVLVTPSMVDSAVHIAEATGLTTGVVGMLLIAFVTSLPEVVTTVSALRLGSPDLAVGNLFGSNVFNMFILGFVDVLYTPGRLLGAISPTMVMAGMLGLMLTALGGMGNVARVERRVLFVEIDALLILITYALGAWLLVSRGLIG